MTTWQWCFSRSSLASSMDAYEAKLQSLKKVNDMLRVVISREKNRENLQMPRYFVWCSCKAWWSQFDSILVPWISWWLDEPWFKATGFKGTPLKPKLLTSYHDTRSTSGLLQILVGHTLLAIKRYKKWLMGHIYYGSGNPCYWHAIFHAILYMYMPKLGRNDFV